MLELLFDPVLEHLSSFVPATSANGITKPRFWSNRGASFITSLMKMLVVDDDMECLVSKRARAHIVSALFKDVGDISRKSLLNRCI